MTIAMALVEKERWWCCPVAMIFMVVYLAECMVLQILSG